jgi:hypothetical protein
VLESDGGSYPRFRTDVRSGARRGQAWRIRMYGSTTGVKIEEQESLGEETERAKEPPSARLARRRSGDLASEPPLARHGTGLRARMP